FGTGVAYVLNYSIIREAGASNASLVTYIIPIFSTLLGIIVLGEALLWNEPVGAIVILVGVAISQGVFTRRRWAAGSRARLARATSGDIALDAQEFSLPLAVITTGELAATEEVEGDE
ncbi:MAG: DMT family transporter, partial [Acidimicrobiales bacterium]